MGAVVKIWRRAIAYFLFALATMNHAYAQPSQQKPIGEYTLHDFAAKWMMQQDDIADLNRYAESNKSLQNDKTGRERVILFGDSITYHWPAETLDQSQYDLVNRGIPGQNSSQMLLRFEDDVVALNPSIVVILAGTNDLRAYSGAPKDLRETALGRVQRNITAMADIAKARNIDLIICALTPIGPSQAGVFRDPATIVELNDWLRNFATTRNLAFVDYHKTILGSGELLNPDFTTDDLHVNAAGYDAMSSLLNSAIENRLNSRALENERN